MIFFFFFSSVLSFLNITNPVFVFGNQFIWLLSTNDRIAENKTKNMFWMLHCRKETIVKRQYKSVFENISNNRNEVILETIVPVIVM